MSEIGMNQARLDEIELRLVGADHRPWMLDRQLRDERGRALVCKASKKASIKAEWSSLRFEKNSPMARREAEDDLRNRGADMTDPRNQGPPTHLDRTQYIRELALFKLCDEATEEMGEFVAHAPRDIEDLLNEVKFLRSRLRDAEKDREEFRKEMLSARVERSTLQEKLNAARRTWREFNKAIGE